MQNLYEKLQAGPKADWVIEIQENETAQEVKSKTSIIADHSNDSKRVAIDMIDYYIQGCTRIIHQSPLDKMSQWYE